MKRELSAVLIVGSLALAACGGGDSQATPETLPLSQLTAEVRAAAPAATQTPVATAAATATADTAAAAISATAAAAAAGPVAAGEPQPGNEAMREMGPGVMGQVTAVAGSMVTVQDQQQETAVTVVLMADTQVYQQAAVDLAAIPVGESILALGTQEGDVFTAVQVQAGMTDGPGGPGGGPQGGGPDNVTPPDGQQPPADMTPPADGQLPPGGDGGPGVPGGMGRAMLSGMVTAAAAGVLTVQTADGSTMQVALADGGQATQQTAGSVADLVPGVQVRVTGEMDGTTVTATRVVIEAAGGLQP